MYQVDMRVYILRALFLPLFVALLSDVAWSQGKPVLIRDEVNKKKDEAKEEIKVHSPELARRDVGVGDFYFKRGNLDAAEARYRDAIDYNTQWPESYLKLIKLFQERKAFGDALAVCDQFLTANPESKDKKKFEELRKKLEARKQQEEKE